MKRKELLWMLLPCLFLLGAGWYFSRHKMAPREDYETGPFRTVATSVQVLPANPREVSEGFDRKVEVVLRNAGQPTVPVISQLSGSSFGGPEKVQLFQGNSLQPLKMAPGDLKQLSIHGDELKSVVLLKLSKLPTGQGDLTLKMQSQIDRAYVVPIKGKTTNKMIKSLPADISVVVRRAGEKVSSPQVSKANPFVVQRLEVEDVSLISFPQDPYQVGDVTLHLYRAPLLQNGAKKPVMAFYDSYIEDGSGKKYFSLRRKKGWDSFNPAWWNEAADGTQKLSFELRLSQFPAKAGRLTFKTKVSVDGCWPYQLSVELRRSGAAYSYATSSQKQPVALSPGDTRWKIGPLP